jgi:hypothetical protein
MDYGQQMKSGLPFSGPNRRTFLRNAALGGLAAITGTLVVRGRRQSCVSDGICRGCIAYADCGRPRALSMKQKEDASK